MRALTVVPGDPASAAVTEMPEPPVSEGAVLVEAVAVALCGTDREIVEFGYGEPPEGQDRLVLGHEAVGTVLEAPPGSEFMPGELVVGIVRAPDPVPCDCCAVGQWDMCRNGLFTERGIRGRHGFGRERWRIDPYQLVKVDPALGRRAVLLEPASIVAKAFEQVLRIGARACFYPRVALVTGAGPIGMLAAMFSVQHGLDTHVVDMVDTGSKPRIVADLGAMYHTQPVHTFGLAADVVIECTGIGQVAIDAMKSAGPNAVMALAGISMGTHAVQADVNAMNNALVLTNQVVFGTVNAARRHYEQGAEVLLAADPAWLDHLTTRHVDLDHWTDGLTKKPEDIKVVVDMPGAWT